MPEVDWQPFKSARADVAIEDQVTLRLITAAPPDSRVEVSKGGNSGGYLKGSLGAPLPQHPVEPATSANSPFFSLGRQELVCLLLLRMWSHPLFYLAPSLTPSSHSHSPSLTLTYAILHERHPHSHLFTIPHPNANPHHPSPFPARIPFHMYHSTCIYSSSHED